MTPATTRTLVLPLLVAGVCLALLLAAIGASFTVRTDGHPATARSAAPSPTASTPAREVAAGSAPAPPAGPRTSTEVQAPGSSPAPALPPSKGYPPLLTGPLPKDASATGALVRGYPAAIPVAGGARIRSSAVATSGTVLQATLVASSADSAADVLAFYRTELAKLGLAGDPLPAVGGSSAVSFARGGDTITVTATPAGGGSRFSVYSVLNAAA